MGIGLIDTFKGVEKKFPWSFSGFVLAVIFGALSVYLGFFKKSSPDLDYIITSNSAVLDVKEELGKLDILYRGESLNEKSQELRFMTIKVINNGDMAITEGSYDSSLPIGFSIINGVLAEEASLIDFSQDYLEENLKLNKENDTDVTFSKIIIDPESSFEIKLLILYQSGDKPSITPIGKIASLDKIDVFVNAENIEEKSFIRSTFAGDFYKQAIRVFIYGIVFFLILIAFVVIDEKHELYKVKRRKTSLVNTFKDYNESRISLRDEIFFGLFLNGSCRCIQDLEYLLSNPKKLLKYQKYNKDKIKFRNNVLNITLSQLVNEEVITIEKNSILVCDERLSILISFIEYLSSKGEIDELSDSAQTVEEKILDFTDDVETLKLNHLKLQGAMALHEKNYAKGVTYFESYLDIEEDDPSVLWKLACCHKRLGNYPKALSLIEKAIKYSDNVGYLLYYNYACYLSLNMKSACDVVEQLRKAIEADDGTTVVSHLNSDTDFENVRDSDEFKELVSEFLVTK